MKLISFGAQGRQSYGVVSGDKVHDLGRRLGASQPALHTAIAAGAIEAATRDAVNGAADFQLG